MTDVNASLGASLLSLDPVAQALADPHFTLTARPIDSRWHYAKFTDVTTGFNPILDTHFYASESVFARWLEDPRAPCRSREQATQLVEEVLRMAHDYLHSWTYRALRALELELELDGPVCASNLDEQAFALVLSEAVAVVGLDYWYLCVADVDERCGVSTGVGPRTVHYSERLLPEYRRFNPKLSVQEPRFFHHILRLYCAGLISGFDERDLLESSALANWLVRELLIAPRQREVSRAWLSRFAGLTLDAEALERPFGAPTRAQQLAATQLAELLWRKIKAGEREFFPARPRVSGWSVPAEAGPDFRFTHQRHRASADVDWARAVEPGKNFSFYVDQYLSRYHLPELGAAELAALAREIDAIKASFDEPRLERLASTLRPVPGSDRDDVPLELMFVN